MTEVQSEQNSYAPTDDGAVVLEIGGEVGALVLRTPAEHLGAEIEIERSDGLRTHAAVRERLGASEPVYAAVYLALAAGCYLVPGVGTVEVVGGEVTDVTVHADAHEHLHAAGHRHDFTHH